MENTTKLNLQISSDVTFLTDDIKQTIVAYGTNFTKLEDVVADSATTTEGMVVGQLYPYAKRLWDSTPLANGHIGWVNLREGVYAPEWQQIKSYLVGDLIRAVPDNGNVYECIVKGRSMVNNPTYLTSAGAEFYDAYGNMWMPGFNYAVNDVAFSTDGSKIFYYICETAGLSSTVEPNWSLVPEGTTTIDGSVVWRKERTITWKQKSVSSNFRPFGKIE